MSKVVVNQEEMILNSIRIFGNPVRRIRNAMVSGVSAEEAIQEMLELASAAFEFASTDSTIEHFTTSAAKVIDKVIEQTEKIYPNELKNITGEVLKNSFFEFEKNVQSELKSQREVLREALQNLGISRNLYKKSPSKGLEHQERVGTYLESLCGTDLIEDVSRSRTGKLHSQRKINSGDFLVSSQERTDGIAQPLFVVEAKDSKLSLAEALIELNENKKNRNVPVGIIIFATLDQAPTNGKHFKVVPGNNIFVVLNEDSDAPITAAYNYAKYLALGLLQNSSVDTSQLKDVLLEIERSIDFEAQINKEAGIAGGALSRLANISLRAREDVIHALKKLHNKDFKGQIECKAQ